MAADPPATESRDYYEVLQVSSRASQEVIQAAYRVLARQSHPDQNARLDAGRDMRQLNAAYAVLANPRQRATYDMERARVRRHERLAGERRQRGRIDSSARSSLPTTIGAGCQLLRPSRRSLDEPSREQRQMLISPQLLLTLSMLAVLLLLVVLVFLVAMSSASEVSPVYPARLLELTDR